MRRVVPGKPNSEEPGSKVGSIIARLGRYGGDCAHGRPRAP